MLYRVAVNRWRSSTLRPPYCRYVHSMLQSTLPSYSVCGCMCVCVCVCVHLCAGMWWHLPGREVALHRQPTEQQSEEIVGYVCYMSVGLYLVTVTIQSHTYATHTCAHICHISRVDSPGLWMVETVWRQKTARVLNNGWGLTNPSQHSSSQLGVLIQVNTSRIGGETIY